MNFINYRNCDNSIETVEDMRYLSKHDKRALLEEYKLISNAYYASSSRATKEFYEQQGDK